MALDPSVQRMTPKQRERWAWGFVVVLALLALLWGSYQYGYKPAQVEQARTTLSDVRPL